MKDILVHARDFRERTAACRYGAQLATAFGAALTAVYASPSTEYLGSAFGAELAGVMTAQLQEHIAEAVQGGEPFRQWAASIGVPQAEWLVADGMPVDALVVASTRHDVLIVDHAEDARVAAWDMPGLILRSACASLVLPRHEVEYEPAGRVAIAWNGSPEAMRAVHSALPLLQGRTVLLLRGEERSRYPYLEWHPPFDIEAYLAQRGVTVTTRPIDARKDEAGIALLDEAASFGASLLVMGAYGRTRFGEWLLGGATRDALTWARLPVLLQH